MKLLLITFAAFVAFASAEPIFRWWSRPIWWGPDYYQQPQQQQQQQQSQQPQQQQQQQPQLPDFGLQRIAGFWRNVADGIRPVVQAARNSSRAAAAAFAESASASLNSTYSDSDAASSNNSSDSTNSTSRK
uniref:Putative salivary polyQ secreted protein n=1 Tax=Toxorhynchites amboinensis TaxID=46208 RepID=A0FIV5_TOXAM|nr:putative salivary polyQ secreted protein [Toxorhynchites amboinensis]